MYDLRITYCDQCSLILKRFIMPFRNRTALDVPLVYEGDTYVKTL